MLTTTRAPTRLAHSTTESTLPSVARTTSTDLPASCLTLVMATVRAILISARMGWTVPTVSTVTETATNALI